MAGFFTLPAVKRYLSSSWPACLAAGLTFFLGLSWGIYWSKCLPEDQLNEAVLYLDNFLYKVGPAEINQSFALREAIASNVKPFFILYLLSLTIIGLPVILGVVFARGGALGFTAGFLCQNKGFGGVLLTLAALLPHNLLLVPLLIFSSAASLSFTVLLTRRFFNSKIKVWPSFVLYTAFMLISVGLTLLASLIEVYINVYLVKIALPYIT